MTRVFYSILIILLLTNCNNETVSVKTKTDTDTLPLKYSKLHNLFQDLRADTIYVYSDWSTENKNFAFKGTAMDSVQVSLLPSDIKDDYNWNKDFGACYKFPLDKSHIALIARTSGEYVSSAIKLFVFNLDTDSIVKTFDLADSWGDAGETSVYNSCVFKDKDKNIFIVSYYWSSYDHSAGNVENDTIVEHWKSYYLYKLSNNIVDTLSKDSAEIVKRYPSIVHRLASY